MKNNLAALHYKNTDELKSANPTDINSILVTCFDELVNSIKLFQENIKPEINNIRKKSTSFSKALTIIYSLQSCINFEKNLEIARSLFQIYEFTRIALIQEFKTCKINKSEKALTALTQIRDSWRELK